MHHRTITFEHVLSSLQLESDHASVYIHTAVTLASGATRCLFLFNPMTLSRSKFWWMGLSTSDTVDACPNNQRFSFTVYTLSRLTSIASAFCRNYFLKIKLKQALHLELPTDAYHHIDVDLVTFAELERILVEIRSSQRKLLKNEELGKELEGGNRDVVNNVDKDSGGSVDANEIIMQSSELSVLTETAQR